MDDFLFSGAFTFIQVTAQEKDTRSKIRSIVLSYRVNDSF